MMSLPRAANRLLLALLIALAGVSGTARAESVSDLQPAWLEAMVNGQPQEEPILILRGSGGALFAGAATLAGWRMRLPQGDPVPFEGELYYRISGLPALRVSLNEAEQKLAVDADAGSFAVQHRTIGPAQAGAMTPPATGLFVDYDLTAEHVGGAASAGGALRLGVFTRFGVGESSFVVAAGSGGVRATRIETNWTIDRPTNATSIRLGDSVSFGGPGAPPVRFAGVQYRRNFAIRPGFVTMPLPAGTGSAAVPSVVDIYVNDALRSQSSIAPGPFEISDIPVEAGSGQVRIVVRDLLGREVVTEQPYYASTALLRRGLHDFSWEVGFLRRDFGRSSNRYGSLVASTSHRYGFSDRLTGEGHVQYSKNRQSAGAALSMRLFDLGELGGSISASRSRDHGWGMRASVQFERRSRHLSFGGSAEYVSADYRPIGASDGTRPPRHTLQAFVDFPVWRGAVGINFLRRAQRDGSSETLAGLSTSFQLSEKMTVQLYARHTAIGRRDTSVGAHLSISLGGRRSLSGSVEQDRRGVSARAALQGELIEGYGGGYRLGAQAGRDERAEASVFRNFSVATVGAELAYAAGTAGLRVNAAGSFALMGGRLFASRSLGDSFARVDVPGHSGLRVYADDRLVGVTDKKGSLIVPGLRPFEANRLRIDDADLPIEAQLESLEQEVRPFARTGSLVRFVVRSERGVLFKVRLADGSLLPAGAKVSLADGTEHVAVSGGEVYIEGLVGQVSLRAAWPGGTCAFTASIPDDDDPQPRLDGLVCRPETRFAGT